MSVSFSSSRGSILVARKDMLKHFSVLLVVPKKEVKKKKKKEMSQKDVTTVTIFHYFLGTLSI